MGFLQRLFGTDKPDREAQAKEHFGGSHSVFNRPNPGDTSQYWEAARQSTPTSSSRGPSGKMPREAPEMQEARRKQAQFAQVVQGGYLPYGTTAAQIKETEQKLTDDVNAIAGRVGNGAWGPYVPMEKPPNAVLQALNEVGFTVNAPEKSAGMPNESFSTTKALADHEYRVSSIEDEFLRTAFNQPSVIVGQQGGTIMPPSTPVDQAMPVMHMEPTESAALTWEAYDALGDQQKAAVDWNTLLIDAREKDFSDSVKIATPEERAAYDAEVTRLFGDQGGSNRYAPNTMKLLGQLDVVQLGQDLDEYLSLERAIDDTQIADFKFTSQDLATLDKLAGGDKELQQSYAATRSGNNISALNTANVQAASNLVKAQLANPEAVTSSFDTLMFGNPDTGAVPLGFGDSVTDQQFQKALTILGSSDVTQFGMPSDVDPMAFLLEDLALQGADEKTQSLFLDYVGQQAQMFSQYGSEEQKTMAALVNKRAGLGG